MRRAMGCRMRKVTCSMLTWVVAATLFALPSMQAFAQYADSDGSDDELPQVMRRNEFMATAHMKGIWAPNFLLDLFFQEHASHWSEGQRNFAYGAQFIWRLRGDYELGVNLDYAELKMPGQFWLGANEDANEAKFTTIDAQMLSLAFTSYWYWDVVEWVSPYIGVGIGAGVLLGEGITEYDTVRGTPCYNGLGGSDMFAPDDCFNEDGSVNPTRVTNPEPAERVPPVVPVLHLAGGLRFNIYKYGVLRLEFGVNDYAYIGASAGVQWW